jgi:hypothetical protein
LVSGYAFQVVGGFAIAGMSAERNVLFSRSSLALSGGPSGRIAAARTGSFGSSLKGIPPSRPLAPVGNPALRRESNPAPHNQKTNIMPAKTAQSASQPKNAASTTGTKLPVKTFRLGRIKAAVWENEADQKKFYNVTFARTYMDDARNYHDADSYGRDDLPLIANTTASSFENR